MPLGRLCKLEGGGCWGQLRGGEEEVSFLCALLSYFCTGWGALKRQQVWLSLLLVFCTAIWHLAPPARENDRLYADFKDRAALLTVAHISNSPTYIYNSSFYYPTVQQTENILILDENVTVFSICSIAGWRCDENFCWRTERGDRVGGGGNFEASTLRKDLFLSKCFYKAPVFPMQCACIPHLIAWGLKCGVSFLKGFEPNCHPVALQIYLFLWVQILFQLR